MADELIDIYDSEMNLLGVALKSQAHQEGLWHKAGHCWIITEDRSEEHTSELQSPS